MAPRGSRGEPGSGLWYGAAMVWAHRASPSLTRRRRCSAGVWVGLLAVLTVLAGGEGGRGRWTAGLAIGWAAPQDEISRRDFGISGFKPPPRWEVLPSERRSYPQLLAWASRGEGADRAVITLIGKRLPAAGTLKSMIDEALVLRDDPRARNVRAQLQLSPGWTPNQRVQLDGLLVATKTQQAQVLRQLIYLNAPFAYVLTLVCPQEQAAARYRDLDDTAANLIPISVAPPASPSPPPGPPPPSPPPPSSAAQPVVPAAPMAGSAPDAAPAAPAAPASGAPSPPKRQETPPTGWPAGGGTRAPK